MKRFALRCILAALLALLPWRAGGELAKRPRFIARWSQSEDGLPGNAVRSVVQAASGYLWVATAEGVVRYDGVRFTGFDLQPDKSLAQLPARALYPFADGSVWIATSRNGLLRWDGRRLRAILPERDGAGPVRQVVAVGADAIVLFGTDLLRISAEGFSRPEARTPALEALLKADADYWADHGRDATPSQVPRLRDRAGRTWRALSSGLTVSLSPGGEQFPIPGVREHCLELHEDREGNLWAATGNSGLLCLTQAKVKMLTAANGLSERTAQALLEGRDGALWVGTKNGALDRFGADGATHFELGEEMPKRRVSALCQDRTGAIWASSGPRLYRGTASGFTAIAATSSFETVSAIVEDRDGQMYFGGKTGVATLRDGALQPLDPAAGGAPPNVITMAVDASGALWVGATAGRLYRRQGQRFELVPGSEILEGASVSSLLPEEDGAMWLTTLGSGLFRWKSGRFTRLSTEEGLPDPRLTCVLDDHAGHLWLGSLAGIFRLDRAEWSRLAAGHREPVETLVFDRADGLVSRECTGGFQPAGALRRDGSVAFPTTHGVALIEPAALGIPEPLPPVVIEECRANGRPLAPRPALPRAGPGRSHLEFRYTALSFTAPGKIKFRVRLGGLEDAWRDVGPLRTVSYESVPPGRYSFQVLAANADGVWNRTGAALALEVLPHAWEQLWFRALLGLIGALLIGGLAWAAERVRSKQRILLLQAESARQSERVRIAQDLHDDLGSRLTEISLLAAFANDDPAAEKRALLTLPEIVAKTRALAAALDEIVWAVNPRYDTVTSLTEYLAAFAAEFLGHAGVAARFDLPCDLPTAALDPERRHSLFLAVREALNNAVKYSGATEVWLRVRCDSRTLYLTIQDNGAGFDPAAVEGGEGFANMARRLKMLGGAFHLESSAGGGASVHFQVPMVISA